MSFKEIQGLDADVTIALGKVNKTTGKAYPKQAEGYYLGKRVVENKRGESQLHFLQTSRGNLGIWGTTDLDRKLSGVPAGSMVRITSTGTKPTPNGDMYTYKVEVDDSNVIDVSTLAVSSTEDETSGDDSVETEGYDDIDASDAGDAEAEAEAVALVAAERAAKAAKVQEILNRGKSKSK